ncbi:helix-turn-helix domain-containing protein [Algoriphagus vanfongensis]|uniref:helix-turn-helix domain-containing protein n=1 Tax=Algoriphagus vanfongensis TaxID=426371 RepID=UPI0004093761|nr:helix-turn-helix domain-containing protein [Algoriphagus vanfongensis]
MYREITPDCNLQDTIHNYWELKAGPLDYGWERIFPDGCLGLVMNLGKECLTDNGSVTMEHGKTYAVGAMTSFKESLIEENTHLIGVCFKPAAFSTFFSYVALSEIKNKTVQFDQNISFNRDEFLKNNFNYLDKFFNYKKGYTNHQLCTIADIIWASKGQSTIENISKQNGISTRQLERIFKKFVGLTPKEFSDIIRFQNAFDQITSKTKDKSLLDIALECGYYDHSHLTNVIKKQTGYLPSEI